MRWGRLSRRARRYLLYKVLTSPLMVTYYMLPVYMYMSGYDVLETGVLFSLIHAFLIPLSQLLGKLLRGRPLKKVLIFVDTLEGVALILYGLSLGTYAPIALFFGALASGLSALFYPVHQMVERVIYPEEMAKEVYSWYLKVSEALQLASYLFFGYLFGYVFNSPNHYRVGFVAFGCFLISSLLLTLNRSFRTKSGEAVEIEEFKFSVDRDYSLVLFTETLMFFAWNIVPEFVLLNYIVNTLKLTLFEVMLVEAAMSVIAIVAAYVSETAVFDGRKAMILGYALIVGWAVIMYLNPPIHLVLLAHTVARFGEMLAFPHYRSWVFACVPKEKVSEYLSTLLNYRKMVTLLSPLMAGIMASAKPTLPYLVSAGIFTLIIFVLTVSVDDIRSQE